MRLPALLERRPEPRWRAALRELVAFAWHEAWSCLFAIAIFAALVATRRLDLGWLPRYDAMLVLCLALQWLLWRLRVETADEVRVICLFHLLGLALEIWKVQLGSWAYPGPGWTKVLGVPLYSGFMYAAVASYMCQAWRRLSLRMERWPPAWQVGALAVAIYGNFFTNRHLPDIRWLLFPAMLLVFARTRVVFVSNGPERRMPLVLSFLLIALFVWFAENLGTFLDAWRYPHQRAGWQAVHLQKLSSWTLLVIVSLILVAQLKRVKAGLERPPAAERASA